MEAIDLQTWVNQNTALALAGLLALSILLFIFARGVIARGLVHLAGLSKNKYDDIIVRHLRPYRLAWMAPLILIYALADFPDTVEILWQTMVERDLEAVHLAANSDYDYFITWEDSSTQNYSPAQYDRYIGSEIGPWCHLLADAGKQYIQHACGHTAALLERMRDHGVCAVESISPPPTGNISLAEARAKIGSQMGIIGGIEPTLFLSLTETQLAAYTESVIADGRGGPFVLANSDSCPPGVTLEKFARVAEIARAARQPECRA